MIRPVTHQPCPRRAFRALPTCPSAPLFMQHNNWCAAPRRRSCSRRTVPKSIQVAHSSQSTGGGAAFEAELLSQISTLGFPGGILPGQGREHIDAAVAQLEASSSPIQSPLRSGEGGAPNPLLFGTWRLVFASNGTVVTRTAAAQVLVAASSVPGVGLRDVQQELLAGDAGAIQTTNSAVFGLGPLGEWQATIHGTWAAESGSLARVAFNAYSVQLLGAFGWRPLAEFLELKIPLPEAAKQRTAEFRTTYLSEMVRIARGSTGNVFVFRRAE